MDKIPYEWREFVLRAVMNARPLRGQNECALWVALMHVFACGSTVAKLLCREFDFDPDKKVKH